jgi:dipeptidyl aminopeptidase/acylaminoacyl peptidase
MMRKQVGVRVLGTGLATVLFVAGVVAQQAPPGTANGQPKTATKRAVRPEDYGSWESLRGSALSPDGRWLAYGIVRTDGEEELRVRMLATEATETLAHGSRPQFSKDAKWLIYTIGVSAAEREKAETPAKTKDAPRDPIKTKLALRNLVGGEPLTFEDISTARFSDDGKFLVMRRFPAKGRESAGADIIVRDLAAGIDTSFGNVDSYAFNDQGTFLALVIDAEAKIGNGVQVYDTATGVLRTLESANAKYTALTWRKDAADLAVLRENDHSKDEDASFVAIAWRDLKQAKPKKLTYDFATDEKFPKEHRVVDFATLRWSDDGQTLFFGIKSWENKPAPKPKKDEKKGDEPKKTESKKSDSKKTESKDTASKKSLRDSLKEPAGVEVWHAKDIDIMPLQKKRAAQKKRESFLGAWWPDDGQFVQLGNDLTENVVLLDGHKHALGLDNTPHESEKKFGPTLEDIYVIDVKTGSRKKVLDRLKFTLGFSPDGRYVLYVKDKNVWSYDLTTATHANLTGALGVSFINEEDSSLSDEKSPYGTGAWTKDGSHVLFYDRYDMWLLKPDGKDPKRLTDGRKDKVIHRRVRLDFEKDGDRYLQLDAPMYVSTNGETSKYSGFARLKPGEKVETLVWKPKELGRLQKAKDADVFAFTEEDYDDAPDIFVAGPNLASARQASQINPFQKEFLWGRSELVDYTSADGKKLQGALVYPANFEPGKTYPMIVYIYERLSDRMHFYTSPSERTPYNTTVFSAEGYFVFMPDIVYRAQNPGLSAVDCVVPAVKKVLENGKIDPKKVGLVGHSWGAYQTAFLVTQTDIFAAGAAGAPLTNMMSMSVSIYANSGQTNAWIFHESQGRMDRPFWQDVDTYIKNSPIFQIDKLKTPLLVTFGDEDGAVNWNQGVELYNAARLVGKPVVMLVYPGENHGLAKKPNQVDYHYRILDWFGHYLKGEKAPRWMTEGQSHLERQKELDALKKKLGGDAKEAPAPKSSESSP